MTEFVSELPITRHWLDRAAQLRGTFLTAEPFPLLVLDDFLDVELAESLHDEFPNLDEMPRSRDYVFGNKRELSSVESSGPAGRQFRDAMLADRFRRFLADATGYCVFVDPDWFGGGYHQGGDGSYLDMHVDFNVHPLHPTWVRMLNILVYLNRDWDDRLGGELVVKATPDAEPRAILPVFNRAVIMATNDRTYHGYRRMTLPPGVTRRSVATYAYRLVSSGEVKMRTTGWLPEDASAVKRFMARHYDTAVRLKNRVLGSGTAKNR